MLDRAIVLRAGLLGAVPYLSLGVGVRDQALVTQCGSHNRAEDPGVEW